MADDQGPWGGLPPAQGKAPSPPGPPLRNRLILIGVCVAIGLGVLWLSAHFPRRPDDFQQVNIGYAVVAGIAAISGLLARGVKFSQVLRYAAIWGGLAVVLLVGYTLKDDAANLGGRLLSEILPNQAVPAGVRSVSLTQSDNGGYYVIGKVNGGPVMFLVDTGSSDIVLSPQDARRVGVNMAALDYDKVYETANGHGLGAAYTASSLAVGPIQLGETPMSVNQAPMSESLLGMTFLRRLGSFEFKGRQLILRGRP